jgi:hypothetical protein
VAVSDLQKPIFIHLVSAEEYVEKNPGLCLEMLLGRKHYDLSDPCTSCSCEGKSCTPRVTRQKQRSIFYTKFLQRFQPLWPAQVATSKDETIIVFVAKRDPQRH